MIGKPSGAAIAPSVTFLGFLRLDSGKATLRFKKKNNAVLPNFPANEKSRSITFGLLADEYVWSFA
jgi:hypothetical protein